MRAVALHNVFCVHRTNEGDAAALQGTTLTVGHGEIVCVLGPSGAGKSTLAARHRRTPDTVRGRGQRAR